MSLVYAIRARGTEYVKVGVATDLVERLSSLQTGSPLELVVLHTVETPVPRLLEARLHARLKPYHVRGEWFAIARGEMVAKEMEAQALILREEGLEPARRPAPPQDAPPSDEECLAKALRLYHGGASEHAAVRQAFGSGRRYQRGRQLLASALR